VKSLEEHLKITDERWIACVEAHHGRPELIRKSAIVAVMPQFQWKPEEEAFVPSDPPRLLISLENGKEAIVLGDIHDFFDKHLKSSFAPSPMEGPGEELLD
jgi:hypothetical protein